MQPTSGGSRSGWARRFVRWLVRRFYPRIEVTGGERIPQSGPVLFCANHANSLIDPVLIGIAARRPVRFLAKAPLFDVPLLGAVIRALGMLPAYRGSDDARQVRRNLESLDAAAEVLQSGAALGIFPEGKSHDAIQVEMVRSGAARIAIQAAGNGAQGLSVVPVGINYEKKERFRSAVWVAVGEPIDVDQWLAERGGDSRAAMRAMTSELDQRLKAVVVHLDGPRWGPFLSDLEILAPRRKDAPTGKAAAVRQRKRIADAMNHFLAADRPRAEAVAAEIAAYRQAVRAEGLRVDGPILRWEGWRTFGMLVWQRVWTVALFLPALLGTLFHIVPFTIVRAGAAKIRAPGRTTNSQSLLLVGLPTYLLWYFAVGWWMFGYFSLWFAATALAAMPFLGLLALGYWRNAQRAAWWWWHQLRFLLRRRRLLELRAQRRALQATLAGLAAEYDRVAPHPVRPPRPPWTAVARRVTVRAACVAALLLVAWFAGHWFRQRALIDPAGGVDLAAIPRATLAARLSSDEAALRAVIEGLDDLESRTREVQADFAAGRRSYSSEADNDEIRRLLLGYINRRTALIRLIWRYQRYAQLEDETLRLRAFLVGYASASALHDASLKFVHEFAPDDRAIARLNEGDPTWGIPAGLHRVIEKNLASPANRKLLEAARQYHAAQRPRFEERGLGPASPHAPFHAAIARAEQTARRLAGSQWREGAVVAAKDLGTLVATIRYQTQSAISTWIGDFKIREPRPGESLIRPEQLARLATTLQPGDVLLERRNWYVSNAFLPGYWPHAALYVGTADDLKRLGLADDPRVKPHWERFAALDDEGHPHVIVEAMSEGVVFSSLEHSIGGADSAAVLRPNLSREEIIEAIAQAFSHASKPYDFEFDFDSRDKLVCTEVVYRAYGANAGPIRFPVREILGRRTMPAIELVRKVKEESAADTAELSFVAFIDGDERTGECRYCEDAGPFFQTLDRPALTMLQGFESDPFERIGLLGWALSVLIASFTLGNLAWYGWRGERGDLVDES
ncbi:MAG: 1-acyl-sn-glycerol-3-phosphate acyltransferase [Planctomycetales bacterium]